MQRLRHRKCSQRCYKIRTKLKEAQREMKYINGILFFASLAATFTIAAGYAYGFVSETNAIAYGLIAFILCIVFGADVYVCEERETKK